MRAVHSRRRWAGRYSAGGRPHPAQGGASPIKHCIYVVKENRTYDQVFGDMKEGNGDPNLCLFGEKITPNIHKLARQFVLLDNLYCDGEVSADGHQWTMGAYATDFVEKIWPLSYRGSPGKLNVYPSEGNFDAIARASRRLSVGPLRRSGRQLSQLWRMDGKRQEAGRPR